MPRANRSHVEDEGQFESEESFFLDESYKEPNSVHITEDWDTMMEDFYDDYEDFQDVDFPSPDEDY